MESTVTVQQLGTMQLYHQHTSPVSLVDLYLYLVEDCTASLICTRSVLASLAACMLLQSVVQWLNVFKFPAIAHACPYAFSWKRSIA